MSPEPDQYGPSPSVATSPAAVGQAPVLGYATPDPPARTSLLSDAGVAFSLIGCAAAVAALALLPFVENPVPVLAPLALVALGGLMALAGLASGLVAYLRQGRLKRSRNLIVFILFASLFALLSAVCVFIVLSRRGFDSA